MRKKRCFLYAYDRQNLGDDLFVHTICKRYPHTQFYMWSSDQNRHTFRELPNLRVVDQNSSLVHCLQKIRASLIPKYRSWLENRCDAVVYIGGSIFIEYENWRQLLTWWEYEAQNRPFYVLGANFGPYRDEDYRAALSRIFSNMQDICFRDRYSKEKFADVQTARQAPDILFGQAMPTRQKSKKRVLFSVVDCRERAEGANRFEAYEEDYLSLICRMAETACQQHYIPVFSSFCQSEGDEIAIEKIQGRLSEEARDQMEIVRYTGTNAEEVLQAIADSDLIVASRFHAAILGFDAEKPVLPIVYSDKTLHVLEDIDFSGKVLDLRDLSRSELCFETVLKNLREQMLPPIARLQKASEAHFKKLDQVLGECGSEKR